MSTPPSDNPSASADVDSEPTLAEGVTAAVDGETSIRCPTCLESVASLGPNCPACDEPLEGRPRLPSLRAPSIPDIPRDSHWLKQHWRPALTLATVGGVLTAGIALRHLAPERYQPPKPKPATTAVAEKSCNTPCWHGEACQQGRCIWRPANNVGHIAFKPTVAGPFELPPRAVDVLPLDSERYATSHLLGVQISNARSGNTLQLVTDAPLAQKLYRINNTFYATAPRRIFVIDAKTTRVLKSIELGSSVGSVALGGGGRRALVSLPRAHAVAVVASEYHAEVARFRLGEDSIGPVAIDDTGKRAVATNGMQPIPGLKASRHANIYGGLYAFNASQLPAHQDRVRTGMMGNPTAVLMLPDATSSFVVLRERNELVPLSFLKSGSVRQQPRIKTCRQPEQFALVRAKRHGLVRCNAGRAIDVVDLVSRRHLRRIPLNARASDMVVSPDGRQAIITLPDDGAGRGALGFLDLQSYNLTLHDLSGEPARVRLTPDGKTAIVISNRKKHVWVVR